MQDLLRKDAELRLLLPLLPSRRRRRCCCLLRAGLWIAALTCTAGHRSSAAAQTHGAPAKLRVGAAGVRGRQPGGSAQGRSHADRACEQMIAPQGLQVHLVPMAALSGGSGGGRRRQSSICTLLACHVCLLACCMIYCACAAEERCSRG